MDQKVIERYKKREFAFRSATIKVSRKLPIQLKGTVNISYESKIIKRNETDKRLFRVFSKLDR